MSPYEAVHTDVVVNGSAKSFDWRRDRLPEAGIQASVSDKPTDIIQAGIVGVGLSDFYVQFFNGLIIILSLLGHRWNQIRYR
ncbi:hypothetical protein NLM33_35660 [Bradyrhizobium sp. CCGUVB1N3]|uniref:hypothetical protein n=1 Tax=Bradyrhizobium sp. CCGUVB1N3 TaxID=2949629 RepID=UPI0020B2E051|nr:hypothetical protein [Bradyrhizobium sp. CCGUVB1N3]MCP3475614.1 hypothetical protein [Bradyrhizobium sp. CCGUVB1N3]